jgi:hypothetical protein
MYGAWYCYQQANECVPSYLIDKVDNFLNHFFTNSTAEKNVEILS